MARKTQKKSYSRVFVCTRCGENYPCYVGSIFTTNHQKNEDYIPYCPYSNHGNEKFLLAYKEGKKK